MAKNTLPVNLRPRGAGRTKNEKETKPKNTTKEGLSSGKKSSSSNPLTELGNKMLGGWKDLASSFTSDSGTTKKKVSNASVSPDVMRKEQLAQRRQQAAKAPAKNAVASSVSNGGSVKSSAKNTAYRNMANRKAQATKQNTTQTQPKKTFNANEAMAQRRAAAQAQGKGNWNANEEMARRRAEAQKKKAYQNAFGGKGK